MNRATKSGLLEPAGIIGAPLFEAIPARQALDG